MHFENLIAAKQPSLDLQLENGSFKMLSKQAAEVTCHLRYMRGEDLHGLTIQELQNLEKILETGLNRVKKRKGELIIGQINDLLRKRCELTEENTRLRYQADEISRLENQQVIADRGNSFHEDMESSESVTIITQSGNPVKNDDSSGASLKLGIRHWATGNPVFALNGFHVQAGNELKPQVMADPFLFFLILGMGERLYIHQIGDE